MPGTYDIYYGNGGNPVQRGVVIATSQTFNVDIPMITMSGSITLNGVAVSGEEFGLVTLENLDGPHSSSAHFRLGALGDPSYHAQILAGTYDVYYQKTSTDLALINGSTRDRVLAGHTGQATSGPFLVIPGTYDVEYTWPVSSGAATRAAPHNSAHRIGCARLGN